MDQGSWRYFQSSEIGTRITLPRPLFEDGLLEEDGECFWAYERATGYPLLADKPHDLYNKETYELASRGGHRELGNGGRRVNVPKDFFSNQGDAEDLPEIGENRRYFVSTTEKLEGGSQKSQVVYFLSKAQLMSEYRSTGAEWATGTDLSRLVSENIEDAEEYLAGEFDYLTGLTSLLEEYWVDERGLGEYDEEYSRQYIRQGHSVEIEDYEFFPIQRGGEIIGNVSVVVWAGGVGEIRDRYVRRGFRDEGIEETLVKRAVDFCRDRDVRKIHTKALPEMWGSLESHGFEREGKLKHHFKEEEHLIIGGKILEGETSNDH